MTIYPTSFSKHKTYEAIRKCLKANPKQLEGSPEVFKGLVMEFWESYGGPVGTLNEFFTVDNQSTLRIICDDGVELIVERINGNWGISTYIL